MIWIKLLLRLSRRIDARVSYTGYHSVQVAHWVKSTAIKMDFDEADVRINYWAALLHDIGKIGVPYNVLSKAGPLTNKEWAVMKLHPTVGSNIVDCLETLKHLAPIIYSHQEKYDGTGYPEGLAGEQIPVGARILGVVDAYEAMTNERAYCKARSHEEAAHELVSLSGKQFDPVIVNVFLNVLNPNYNGYNDGKSH